MPLALSLLPRFPRLALFCFERTLSCPATMSKGPLYYRSAQQLMHFALAWDRPPRLSRGRRKIPDHTAYKETLLKLSLVELSPIARRSRFRIPFGYYAD
jgi:hypothetical protein